MSQDTIEHEGIVAAVNGRHVQVSIGQVAACSECKARSLCTSSESKEKLIDVYEDGAATKYRVGEHVRVCGALSMGHQAVRLAFGVPLALIVLWLLLALIVLRMHELAAVGVLAFLLTTYFYILYMCREKMARKFAVWIDRDKYTN